LIFQVDLKIQFSPPAFPIEFSESIKNEKLTTKPKLDFRPLDILTRCVRICNGLGGQCYDLKIFLRKNLDEKIGDFDFNMYVIGSYVGRNTYVHTVLSFFLRKAVNVFGGENGRK
jgi:hypothetical protein